MKKLQKLIWIFLILNAFLACSESIAKEYGIALILPKEYSLQAKKMSEKIAGEKVLGSGLPNVSHITLFQGNFSQKHIREIASELKKQDFKKIKIMLEPEITTSEQRYINWPVKKNEELQNLHEKILQIAYPYHEGILARYFYSNNLSKEQQKQLEIFGMPGVLEDYNPHVTIFYSKKNPEIEKIAKKIPPFESQSFEAASLAIAEIDYSGNIERILYIIDLK